MKLSRLERYMISNQLRILEALYPDEAGSISRDREILENGYELLYDDCVQGVYPDGDIVSEAECREVWDTMDMFEGIFRSLEALGKPHSPGSKFKGYSGNSETKFMSFAQFTVNRDRRFVYLPLETPGYFNSHIPMRETYGRMLSVWKDVSLDVRYQMDEAMLEKLLAAQIHPDNR